MIHLRKKAQKMDKWLETEGRPEKMKKKNVGTIAQLVIEKIESNIRRKSLNAILLKLNSV